MWPFSRKTVEFLCSVHSVCLSYRKSNYLYQRAQSFPQYKCLQFFSTSSYYASTSTDNTSLPFIDNKYRIFLRKVRHNYEDMKLTSPKRTVELFSLVDQLEKTECALTNVDQTLEILQDDAADEELRDLARDELHDGNKTFNEAFNELLSTLVVHGRKVPSVGRDVVLELSSGVGGAEAMLFCQDLWNMYHHFAVRNGWQFTQQEHFETDLDGLRRGQALICPDRHSDAYSLLQYEAGIHRVQRVPKTEKAGRIHTSTVAVVVMLQPTEFDIEILPKDLKVDAFRSKGAGGQSVNTADSAIRITHLPTGTVVECQQERAQHRNRALAMARLRSLLYEREKDKELAASSVNRKLQVGTRGRSEKIRTYNFSQDRVTDHRIGLSIHNVNGVLAGDEPFQQLLSKLKDFGDAENMQVLLESEPLTDAAANRAGAKKRPD